jgi:predicted permease
MEIVILLLKRLVVMFLFMGIGAYLFKKKHISEEGSKSLGNLLIRLILPCVIINAFLVERTAERINAFLVSVAVSVVLLTLSIIVSRLLFGKDPVRHFASAFSNPGFFGIPLIAAVLSSEAVFYVAPFIACLNILQWTYGVSVLKEEKIRIDIKNILCSPFIISFAIGIVLFLSGLQVPDIIGDVISGSASLNTPIAMIVSGVYLAKVNLKSMVTSGRLYLLTLARLCIIPLISAALLCILPGNYYELKICLLIASACPVGSNVAVYAQLHNKDYVYAVETVVLSTLFSIITIPLLLFVFQGLWM